jgi:hypothetical protein
MNIIVVTLLLVAIVGGVFFLTWRNCRGNIP